MGYRSKIHLIAVFCILSGFCHCVAYNGFCQVVSCQLCPDWVFHPLIFQAPNWRTPFNIYYYYMYRLSTKIFTVLWEIPVLKNFIPMPPKQLFLQNPKETARQKNGYAHCELTDSSAFTPFSAAFTLVTLTRLSFKLYAALFSAPSEL